MGKIKIAIFPRRYFAIKKQLESYGLREYDDFLYYNFFVANYNYFVQNKVLVWKLTVAMTTMCTLKCRDCNMFIPYYDTPSDLHIDELTSDLDALFERIDYVEWYAILGGEPLLHSGLLTYLHWLGKYAKRIAEIVIDTNGTIVPKDELLDFAKSLGNVRIMVNNYRVSERYGEKHGKVVKKLKDSGISYTLREYDWSRYRRSDPIAGEDAIKKHYMRCNAPFTAFQNGRFYTCHLPWSAARCGLLPDDPCDYLDLKDPTVTDLDIIKAGLGHLPRGYTSNCEMCNGCDPELYEKIEKAVQL